MRTPWPRVCTGYMVNLNHLWLTRGVCARSVAACWAAHLLILWQEMEMHGVGGCDVIRLETGDISQV